MIHEQPLQQAIADVRSWNAQLRGKAIARVEIEYASKMTSLTPEQRAKDDRQTTLFAAYAMRAFHAHATLARDVKAKMPGNRLAAAKIALKGVVNTAPCITCCLHIALCYDLSLLYMTYMYVLVQGRKQLAFGTSDCLHTLRYRDC